MVGIVTLFNSERRSVSMSIIVFHHIMQGSGTTIAPQRNNNEDLKPIICMCELQADYTIINFSNQFSQYIL